MSGVEIDRLLTFLDLNLKYPSNSITIKMVFTLGEDIFVVIAYYRNGIYAEGVGWQYSVNQTYHQFEANFPECVTTLLIFSQHCFRVVERYLSTGNLLRGKSPGRSSITTNEVIEDVTVRMGRTPRKSIRKLSFQTGLILALLPTFYVCL